MHAAFRFTGELHPPVDQGENGMIAAEADVASGIPLGAALTHQDVAGDDFLTAELLDAEAPAFGVAPVAGRAACLFMCHGGLLLGLFDSFGGLAGDDGEGFG